MMAFGSMILLWKKRPKVSRLRCWLHQRFLSRPLLYSILGSYLVKDGLFSKLTPRGGLEYMDVIQITHFKSFDAPAYCPIKSPMLIAVGFQSGNLGTFN